MKNSEPDPGTTIVLAAVVVYSVILVEIAMYLVATPLFMAGTLALAIAMAGVVGRFITRVLDDAAGPLVPAPPALVEVGDRVEIAQEVVEPVTAEKPRRLALPGTLHHA